MMHAQDPIEFIDEHGNVIAHTTGGFILPLLASLAPIVIQEILKRFHPKGSGIGFGKIHLRHKGKHHLVKKTKGKGLVEDALTFLVPSVPGHGIGFGGIGFGVPHSTQMIHHKNPIEYGEITYPIGGTAHTQRRPRRTAGPVLRHPRGGFAVDQNHSGSVSGFRVGPGTSMFPVNLAK